jgi:hypothetical protein
MRPLKRPGASDHGRAAAVAARDRELSPPRARDGGPIRALRRAVIEAEKIATKVSKPVR